MSVHVCDVPGCSTPGYWEGVCTCHHKQAEADYPLGVLAEVGRDLKIELALDGASVDPTPSGKIKIHAVPLAWHAQGGSPYGRAVLERQVERVGMCDPGARNEALNRAAYVVGGYVGGGELDRDRAAEALLRAAEIAGLPLREAASTIRSGLRKGMAKPIIAPPR